MEQKKQKNQCLNEFYDSHARVVHEVHHLLVPAMTQTNTIVTKMKEEDKRFQGQMITVGSMGSGVMSVDFYEGDVLLPVFIDGKIEQTEDPEYVKFKLSDSAKSKWNDCCDENNYLNPTLFSGNFHALVERSLGSIRGDVNLTGKGTVVSTLKFPLGSASVDLVVTVQCKGWPAWSMPDWFKVHARRPCFPSKETIKEVHDRGIELVANNFAQANNVWRLSYSLVETLLIQDAIGYYPSFKKLLIILKALRTLYLIGRPEAERTFLFKSYHLKILILQEVLDFPERDDWNEHKLAERFASVLERLKSCINKTNF